MNKSIFFRRVLTILLLALLLWTVLTAVLYALISRPIFTQIKVSDMQPKAEAFADLASQSFLSGDVFFNSLLRSSYELFDAWVFVVDGVSGDIRNTSLPATEAAASSIILTRIDSNLETLLTGDYASLWFTEKMPWSSGSSEALFIGVPVKVGFGANQLVVGALFFVAPMDEMNAGLTSMNIALLYSALLVLLVMAAPVYLISARLIRPLRQTRDIALAMANGDFSLRADTNQRGEIGELAATMNHLADKLALSIADLTLERNRLRQILGGMSEGLLAVSHDLQITQANPALTALLGFDQPPRAGSSLHDIGLNDGQLTEAYDAAIAQSREVTLTIHRGSRIIQGQVAPLCDESDTGKVSGAVGLFRDITEAERLEQTRRDYVANVSHELRTPLTAMRALVEPLRDGMVSTDQDRQRYYGIILQEIIRLSRLINDMLELSRLQAGNLAMPISTINLEQLLRDLADRVSLQAEDAGLTFELPTKLAGCPPVRGNPDRIEQVLIILVDNAIKFTPAGGRVSISVDWNERQVLISVADTGSGILPEDIDYVFERFYKADKAHQQPGTGLGLAIAREILSQMGQTITVRSQPGQGAVFTFTLAREL